MRRVNALCFEPPLVASVTGARIKKDPAQAARVGVAQSRATPRSPPLPRSPRGESRLSHTTPRMCLSSTAAELHAHSVSSDERSRQAHGTKSPCCQHGPSGSIGSSPEERSRVASRPPLRRAMRGGPLGPGKGRCTSAACLAKQLHARRSSTRGVQCQ